MISNLNFQGGRYWIIYHKYDELGFPAEGILDKKPNVHLSDFNHAISTKKSFLKSLKGDDVFLILGRSVNKKKLYYLWNRTTIEKVDPVDRHDLYNGYGPQTYMDPPQLLNDKPGFEKFFTKAGHFSIGLQNITDWDFLKIIKKLFADFRCTRQSELTYKDYLTLFEKHLPK